MPRYRKQIWAGDVYEAEEYFSPREIGKNYTRGANELLTTEEQKERNAVIARKKLSRQINTNFGVGDLFITLTHRGSLSLKEAKKALRNFFRRLMRFKKKQGEMKLKYIAVTENESKKLHHHLVINATKITPQEITDIWGLGRVMVSVLEPGGDYTGLARYITKENVKDCGKRWSNSRNLEEPRIETKKLKTIKPKKRLQTPEDYMETERYEFFSEEIGLVRYLKAIRKGGADYGEGEPQSEHTDR